MPERQLVTAPANTSHTICEFDNFWDDIDRENPYAFLSNFHEPGDRDFTIELPWTGVMIAPTTEHLFAAAKASKGADRVAILDAETPGASKGAGRSCDLVPFWETVKLDVMQTCLWEKFDPLRNADLAERLVDTYPQHLREGTHWDDRVWGVDSFDDDAPGRNWLGMLLMDTRSRLMDGLPLDASILWDGADGPWSVVLDDYRGLTRWEETILGRFLRAE